MEHARCVDANKEKGDSTCEVDDDRASNTSAVDADTLVGGEITKTASALVQEG